MITVRAGSVAIGLCLVLLASGCSREQQDWRSAEAADTIDSYGQFIQRHPESELVTQARTRVAQLGEDRDWQRAGSADTVDAYREFIAQHPSGKWAQEANIRIQNFSLGEQAGTDAASKATGSAGSTSGGGRVASSRSSADKSAGAGLAVGGPRAAPAVPAGTAGSASGVGQPARPASVAPSDGARSYGLAQPGDAATSAGSATARGPTTTAGIASAGGLNGQASVTASGLSPPTASAVGSAIAKGAFGIQLGAFSSEGSATAQWRTLATKYASQLQGLQQHVVPADTASGRVYRLQATVGNEDRARAICVQLRTYGQPCVAVLPH